MFALAITYHACHVLKVWTCGFDSNRCTAGCTGAFLVLLDGGLSLDGGFVVRDSWLI